MKSRREKIVFPQYSIGYNGKNYWYSDAAARGKAKFYTNLYFYFVSMPFVLADEGIIYEKAKNLEFEGKSYPGIHITFEENVGVSSNDEYFLHYDPESYQVTWLGYKITYQNRGGKNVQWIKYNGWEEVEGILLAKKLSWYTKYFEDSNNLPDELKWEVPFSHIQLSASPCDEKIFEIPEGALILKAKPKK